MEPPTTAGADQEEVPLNVASVATELISGELPIRTPSPSARTSSPPRSTSAGSEAPEDVSTARKSRIQYRREYVDPTGGVLYAQDLGSDRIKPKESPYAIIVTDVFSTNQDKDTYRPKEETDLPPTAIASLSTQIEIKSQAVIHALRCIIGYYPELILTGDTVRIEEPFMPLYFYRQELQEYHDQFASSSHDREKCSEDANVAEDIKLLLDIFEERYGQKVLDELARHKQEKPKCTHDMTWMLLKPGTDFYMRFATEKVYNAAVLRDVRFNYTNGNSSAYTLGLWQLRTDGGRLGPGMAFHVELDLFTGEKEIADLPAFPCKFMRKDNHGTSHEQRYRELVTRGQMYVSLSKESQLLSFDGKSNGLGTPPVRGRVMVDMRMYCAEVDRIELPAADETSGLVAARCNCPHCVSSSLVWSAKRVNFTDYFVHDLDRFSERTEHQNFLCSPHFPAYVLKHREWAYLWVEGFSHTQFKTTLMETLVVPLGTRQLLQSLCRKFTSGPTWSADFVEGKGEGSIVLLHGRPGVGKTYTAECVAEETKRPLISLTSADIGTDPLTVEHKLSYWFKLAKAWKAILLLDEADVFLERRSATDLVRNNLVAIFLRTLEYYQGILFLTTNRIGTFDEAFISRIDVPIYFPALTDSQRIQIWTLFIRKLEEERQDKVRVAGDLKYYIKEDRDLLDLEWNGREIRSGFQTAVALAEIEGLGKDDTVITVKKDHVATVVAMSKEFKHYLKGVHQQSADDLAASMRLRYDPSSSETKGTGSGGPY